MKRTGMAVMAWLVAALPTHAAGPQVFEIASSTHGWSQSCGVGERLPTTTPCNLAVQIHNDQGEVWRTSLGGVVPGDTVAVETPWLADGAYRIWVRYSRDGVHGCDSTLAFTVSTPDTTAPADTVSWPYVARPFVADMAIFDLRQGAEGRLVHMADVARWLNAQAKAVRP